ncbi:MAG TPA: methyltransferase, FxLD system [Blastocatellia bacterium]|nr:methyltransferase, FxLD system [Blastocatellia bacterium]
MDTDTPIENPGDFSVLQQGLIDQLKNYGLLTSPKVEAAMHAVPRHLFLPDLPLDQVYRNEAIVTKREGERPLSSSSQPSAMVTMLEQLALEPGHHVLEIGAGTGFNAALMAELVGETGTVTTIDLDEETVREAREHLAAAGFERVRVHCADGAFGYPDSAPYDRIILTVGADEVPPAWSEQLKPGGRLVVPLVILPNGMQRTIGFEHGERCLVSTSLTHCFFMPLRGALPAVHIGEERRIELGPEPGLRLHLNGDEQRPVDAELIYRLLTGPSRDYPTGISVSIHEVFSRYALWSMLNRINSEDEYFHCGITAEGEMTNRGLVPYLVGQEGKFCSTGGLLKGESLALWMRSAGRPLPPENKRDEASFENFEISIRSYGPDPSLVEYLIERISQWDAAGRPPDERRFRIRAYGLDTDYTPLPNEILVDRRVTRLIIDW